MRKKKMRAGRIISMLLAVTMVLTSLPQSMMSVSAAEIVSEDTVSSDVEKEGEKVVNTLDGETSEAEKPESEVSEDSNPEESNQGEDASDDDGSDAGTPEGDKPDGTVTDDDKSGEGTSQDGESGEEGSEENKEQESEDGVSDDENVADEVSADTETYDEAEPDMLEQGETVYIQFYSKDGYEYFDISDIDDGDIGTEIAIGNPEEASFKVIPHEGYVITGVTTDFRTGARIAKKETGAGYECKIYPVKNGYLSNYVTVTITVEAKSDYNLTFKYADEDVEALVATNGKSEYQPKNNVAIQTTNESATSFRLKMKGDKAPIVVQEPVGNTDPEERINLTPDVDDDGRYEKDGEGYYCYSPGKILEDTVITIEEGCRVSFEYDKAEISDLYRVTLEEGDEDDIGMEDSSVSISRDDTIVGEILVAKGETLYFGFERDPERLGIVSVIDGEGKPCKEIFDPNSYETVYKVIPQGNTKVIIEVEPYEIPVKYVDSTVKNISISSTEDEQITFDAVEKKITNIYKTVEACNISFELEEGKPLDRVEALYYYDYGNGEEDFEYGKIEVTQDSEGVYRGSFSIHGSLSEIRIVAGESYTLNFEISDGVYLYDRNFSDIEIGPDNLYTVKVTDGDDYIIRMLMKDEYYLATPFAVATIGEETRELEVINENYADTYSYHLEITPTTDMDIKISLVPKSIPFNYAEGSIKDIAVNKGKAALSGDKKNINIYSYEDLEECEITFTLEDGKTVTRAYCECMVPVYDDEWMEVIGSKTYTENIPIVPNGDTNSYKLDQSKIVSKIWNSGWGWVDSIYVVAGDTSEITFDVPEGKATVYSFNNYSYDYMNGALTSPVEAVQNEEYLFGVIQTDDYNAASITITAGTDQEELKVKSYVKYDWEYDEEETIAYYSYTPTKASETIKVSVNPQSIPVKYEADAVKNLSLVGYETDAVGIPELEGNKVLLWNYNTRLNFALELESGKKLSGIFAYYAGADADSSVEKEIKYAVNDVNGRYEFDINNNDGDLGDLLEIEIVTDKVNLSDCKVTLSLDNAELSKDDDGYYTSYKARAIEPEVTLTYYDDDDTDKTLDKDEYVVSYEDNRKVGIAVVTIKPKEGAGCAGSKAIKFRIDKAQAPAIAEYNIYTEAGDSANTEKNNRTLNISKRFDISTILNEEGVEPISYSYVSCTPGGVLDSSVTPTVEAVHTDVLNNKGQVIATKLLYYQLNYSIDSSATEDSQPGTIVLGAEFDNYASAQITIEVSVKEKTTLKLGAEKPSSKKYDAEAFSYGMENVYVVGENSNDIMDEIRDSIRFHYTGKIGFRKNGVEYDSYEAPVEPGEYELTVEIAENNDTYKAEPCNAGDFRITLRNIIIKAEPVEINVGGQIPEEYPYTIDDTELLPGDTIVSKPVLRCSVRNTETEGRYEIKVDVDEVEDFDIINSDGVSVYNYYYVETKNSWLTISKVEVVKKQIMLIAETDETLLAKTYDGEAFDAASLIEAKDGAAVVTDAIIDIKYSGDSDTNTNYPLSSKAPVNAGTYTVKAKIAASDNQYKSEEISFKIVINKAAAPTLQEQAVNAQAVTADTTETLDIAQYIPTGYEVTGYGTVGKTDPNNVLTGNEQVSAQGLLSYTLKAGAATGTAVLTIPVEFKNHIGATLTVKINLTSKTLLTLTQDAEVAVDSEYNGNAYMLPAGAVTVSGTEPGKDPKLVYVYTIRGSVDSTTALHAGQYTVKVTVAEDDENYVAKAPLSIDFEITKKTVNVKAKSGEWNKAFDERPTAAKYPLGYDADGLIGSDNLMNGPASYAYTYNVGGKETVLPDTDDAWKALETGTEITVIPAGAKATDDYEVAYTAGKLTVTGLPEGEGMFVPEIAPMTYTGSQLKPQVKVYVIKNGEAIELTTRDYRVTYGANKDAGKDNGTVTITGKGNYTNVITKKFDINKASIGNGSENKELGITLKYTDQSLNTKATKLVTSLKYKKALKEGTDFTVTLIKEGVTAPASKTEGNTAAKTPTGDDKVVGAYTLRIEAKSDSNYSGYIEKTVYIAGKDNLIKNAKITLKKKSFKWDEKTSGTNYNETNWGGFYLVPGSSKNDKDFTVSMGSKYLTNMQTSANVQDEDSQYFISYTNNERVGTATITITGDGKTYFGTKSATFKINGTPFKAGTRDGNIILPATFTDPETYTGKEITKDLSTLGIVGKSEKLTEGTDYSVTYSGNHKNRGNAAVIITADPKSGYTGSIRKSFKIATADLKKAINNGRDGIGGQNVDISFGSGEAANEITEVVYKGAVPYSKSGATISGLIFTNREGQDLKAGTDYTVKYSYADKRDKKVGSSATMTLRGKGNYSGTLDVTFTIGKAAYSELDVSVASVKLGRNAAKPKVTVKDGKKALTVSENDGKEVKVSYANNEPEKVQAWLAAGAPEGSAATPAPTVTITMNNANYEQTLPETRTLNIYSDKLVKTKLTINWRDTEKTTDDFTYNNGEQVKPVINSITYDGKTYTVKTVGKDCCAYDSNNVAIFKITYGANNKSGRNAGSVTIEGLRLYGGKLTEKFDIKQRDISKK